MLFTRALLAVVSAVGATAMPLDSMKSSTEGALAKRVTEGVHLVYCGSSDYKNTRLVVYCPDDGNCNQTPASDNLVSFDAAYGSTTAWEGAARSVTFPTNVPFTWTLVAGASTAANYVYVGSGSNTYKRFDIFKDDGHAMFVIGAVGQCYSIYYGLPV